MRIETPPRRTTSLMLDLPLQYVCSDFRIATRPLYAHVYSPSQNYQREKDKSEMIHPSTLIISHGPARPAASC